MRYLHTMVRVTDLDASLRVDRDPLALEVTRRGDVPAGRSTLVYLAPRGQPESEVDLTHNWDPEVYAGSRSLGHVLSSPKWCPPSANRVVHGSSGRPPGRQPASLRAIGQTLGNATP